MSDTNTMDSTVQPEIPAQTDSAAVSNESSTQVDVAASEAQATELKEVSSWEEAMHIVPKHLKGEAEQEPQHSEETQEAAPVDPLSAMHKIMVDGKETEVPLKDLYSNYSGKVAYDKKFSTMDKERQSFKKEMDEVYSNINQFNNLVGEGKVMDAIAYLGQFANVPPHHLKHAIVRSLKSEYDRLATLSPEQMQLEFYKQEADYLRNVKESEAQKSKQQQSSMELERASVKLRETHNIKEQEWEAISSALQSQKEAGEFNGNITPDLVAEIVLDSRIYDKAESAVSKVSPELLKNEKLVKMLVFHAKENPDFTEDDLQQIVKAAYQPKNEVKEALATKVAQKVQPKQQQKQEAAPLSAAESQYLKAVWG